MGNEHTFSIPIYHGPVSSIMIHTCSFHCMSLNKTLFEVPISLPLNLFHWGVRSKAFIVITASWLSQGMSYPSPSALSFICCSIGLCPNTLMCSTHACIYFCSNTINCVSKIEEWGNFLQLVLLCHHPHMNIATICSTFHFNRSLMEVDRLCRSVALAYCNIGN